MVKQAAPSAPTGSTVKPRRRDAAANRDRLLAAASQVFAEQGLSGSLEEIARRAQVSIGTLYNHFGSREALFDEIFPVRISGLAEVAETALGLDDAWEGFVLYVSKYFELQAEDRGLNEALTRRYPNAAALEEACRVGFAKVQAVIDRAKDSGELRADFVVQDLACVITATSALITVTNPVAPNGWRRFVAIYLDGLRAEAAHSLPEPPMTHDQVATAMTS